MPEIKKIDNVGEWIIGIFEETIQIANRDPVHGSEIELWVGVDGTTARSLIKPIEEHLGRLLGKVQAENFFEVILREDSQERGCKGYRIFLRTK